MTNQQSVVHVYWRPGCGACRSLQITLAEAGVDAEWHNIWDDDEARAFVRSVAGGNETVPTVVIGGRAHVAPSTRRMLEEIAGVAPQLIRRTHRWPPLRVVQWVSIVAILVASILVSRAGRPGWAYALDALAILTYLALRRLRSRSTQAAPASGR